MGNSKNLNFQFSSTFLSIVFAIDGKYVRSKYGGSGKYKGDNSGNYDLKGFFPNG